MFLCNLQRQRAEAITDGGRSAVRKQCRDAGRLRKQAGPSKRRARELTLSFFCERAGCSSERWRITVTVTVMVVELPPLSTVKRKAMHCVCATRLRMDASAQAASFGLFLGTMIDAVSECLCVCVCEAEVC